MALSETPLTPKGRADVLLEEYRAMYSLALFRLQALDRRVPLTIGSAAAALAAVSSLPWNAQVVVLIAVPASLIWVLRTTISHAKSFEDCLRRIEQIETEVNNLAGASLLMFQSHHPSRGRTTGGRSGLEAVISIMLVSALVLIATGWLAQSTLAPRTVEVFVVFLASIGVYLLAMIARLHRYRYQPAPLTTEPSPPHTTVFTKSPTQGCS